MLQTMNMPLDLEIAAGFGGWDGLRQHCARMGLDGLEGIWNGLNFPEDVPSGLFTGYHLTFWPDWVDFWRQDQKALSSKLGPDELIRSLYGGLKPEDMLEQYRQDIARAVRLGAKYLVFHVSDVSIEEGYTYRWQHTHDEVIDAALEVIRCLLPHIPEDVDFLVENQWWPGFTFTDPAITEKLLSGIGRERCGIMLDTGHLMNCRRSLRSQAEGLAFIHRQLDKHGSLADFILGMHLHQSLSGKYVAKTVGKEPPPEGDYVSRVCVSYPHITRIDRHRPWTDPAVRDLVDRIGPKYLTHELSGFQPEQKLKNTAQQMALLK